MVVVAVGFALLLWLVMLTWFSIRARHCRFVLLSRCAGGLRLSVFEVMEEI